MFSPIAIAPSILSADFMNLQHDIDVLRSGGARYVHVDVMDGHFVPNLTMGVPLVKQLKKTAGMPLDVHLMIDNPLRQIPWFIDAGADIVTVHVEALEEEGALDEAISMISDMGAYPAVAIKPKTPVSTIEDVIDRLHMVLVMSVEPGFSGQSYIEGSEDKVAEVAALARKAGVSPLIEVDGGIGVKTAPLVCACGADVLVAGNAVCAAPDPASAIAEITAVAEQARISALEKLKA
ncbi:MAG: ribulose-phosphate 3-epimerase [Eggerthellaceae bacterium]|nr:ribulose-phosphate 3-epimerase [Eggerthellaceae bacterium]